MRAPSTGRNIKLFYLFARCLLSIYRRNHGFLLQLKVLVLMAMGHWYETMGTGVDWVFWRQTLAQDVY